MTSVVSNICQFIQVRLSCIVDWLILNCLTVLVNFSFSSEHVALLICDANNLFHLFLNAFFILSYDGSGIFGFLRICHSI